MTAWSWCKRLTETSGPTKLQLPAFMEVSNYAVWEKKHSTSGNYIQTDNF